MNEFEKSFGDTKVQILRDGSFEASTDYLIHDGGEDARTRMVAGLPSDTFTVPVNCFLLRGPHGTMLVDTGFGTASGEGFGNARRLLKEAGVKPEDIGHVLMTHLHSDHVLGLFEGDAAFLPSADILVPEADLAYFTDPDARAEQPEDRRQSFDLAAKMLRVYGDRVKRIAPGPVVTATGEKLGIEAVPLPGHSPGHTGYLVHASGGNLMIWADTVHYEAIQGPDPRIGLRFDNNPSQAVRTREALLARCAAENWVVAGNHVFGFRRVRKEGDAYRIIPA